MTNILPPCQPLSHWIALVEPSKNNKGHPRACDRGHDTVQIKRPPVVWAASLLAQLQCGTRFALNKGQVNRLP